MKSFDGYVEVHVRRLCDGSGITDEQFAEMKERLRAVYKTDPIFKRMVDATR